MKTHYWRRPTMKRAMSFLDGVGDIDGVRFGEEHPKFHGRFWWRHYLQEAYERESKGSGKIKVRKAKRKNRDAR